MIKYIRWSQDTTILESPFELSESVGLIDFSVRICLIDFMLSKCGGGKNFQKKERVIFFICYNICGKGSSSSIAKK